MESRHASPVRTAPRRIFVWLGASVLSLAAHTGLAQPTAADGAATKVIYEIPTKASARPVLRAVEAHLGAHGAITIAVVAHGRGVEALLRGANDAQGVPYAPTLHRLAQKGVDFAVCGASLKQLGIATSRVVAEGRIVPSGSGEIARLVGAGYQPLN
ncbi:MAG: DsrE family protein [Gemmatimonadota bacterium]